MNNEFNQNNNMGVNTEPVTIPVISTEPITQPVTNPLLSTEPVAIPNFVNTPVVTTEPVTVPVTQPVTTPVVVPQNNEVIVNNDLKKVEIKEYQSPSKTKIILLILFFVLLVLFIFFLPDITALIDKYKSGGLNYDKEVIETGSLKCFLNSNTSDLDKNYDLTFKFTDSKLDTFKMVLTTRGDATLDKEELSNIAIKCKNLAKESETLDGVSVRCDVYDDRVIETQTFNLENVDYDKLDAAYSEAGGVNPGYKYSQDINVIEKNMNASGYTCQREK